MSDFSSNLDSQYTDEQRAAAIQNALVLIGPRAVLVGDKIVDASRGDPAELAANGHCWSVGQYMGQSAARDAKRALKRRKNAAPMAETIPLADLIVKAAKFLPRGLSEIGERLDPPAPYRTVRRWVAGTSHPRDAQTVRAQILEILAERRDALGDQRAAIDILLAGTADHRPGHVLADKNRTKKEIAEIARAALAKVGTS